MFSSRRTIVSFVALFCIGSAGRGALAQPIIYVDDDAPLGGDGASWQTAYTYLQDALAAAESGDEIRVAAGMYRPDQDAANPNGMGSRSATFALVNGVALRGGYQGCPSGDCSGDPDERDIAAHETVLSGDLNGNDGLDFRNNHENSYHVVWAGSTIIDVAGTMVDGFTITGGNANGAAPPDNLGGGCYCSGNPSITHCSVTGNSVGGSRSCGGGVYCAGTSVAEIRHCRIFRNSATGPLAKGGGVYTSGGSVTIDRCHVFANSAEHEGGGITLWHGGTISRSEIHRNRASHGGGLNCAGIGSPTIAACSFRSNTSNSGPGGGVLFTAGTGASMVNCTINGNVRGGVDFKEGSRPTLVNCTITGNTSAHEGAFWCSNSSPTLTSCILWNDSPYEVAIQGTSYVTISNSNVRGGQEGIYFSDEGGDLDWLAGNIDEDPTPAFDVDGHLMPGSPCIDAGNNNADVDVNMPGQQGLPEIDCDGNNRFLDDPATADTGVGSAPIVDMGAHEFDPAIPAIAVSTNAIEFAMLQGGSDPEGQSILVRNCGGQTLHWQIQETSPWLEVDPPNGTSEGEVDVSTVTVVNADGLAQGIYSAVLLVSDQQASNTPRHVEVLLYVGIPRRVPSAYDTIQHAIYAATSGDVVIVADGEYRGNGNKDLALQGRAITVRSENGPAHCLIDCEGDGRGFSVSRGEGPSTRIEGFTIVNGAVEQGGSGIYCWQSSPTIVNCTIKDGTADYGGGISCDYGKATIINCVLTDNQASGPHGYGGGIAVGQGSPLITGCVIKRNKASGYGGSGIGVFGGHTAIANCVISANTAGGTSNHGGALYFCDGRAATMTNCTVTNNRGGFPATISCHNNRVSLTNCVLWNNASRLLVVSGEGEVQISHSVIQGGQEEIEVWDEGVLDWHEGNTSADPLLAFEGDAHLAPGSPCIDAGVNAADIDAHTPGVQTLPDSDADGAPRFLDDPATEDTGDGTPFVIDLGAFEFNTGVPRIALSAGVVQLAMPPGSANPVSEALSIRNCGGGTLEWQIEESCEWLEVDPASGESAGEVDTATLTVVDADSLGPGSYTCSLTVTAPDAVNTPRQVVVTLYVGTTRRVPVEHSTIQEAIDAATPGDVIIVADGEYRGEGNRNLDFGGKAITVRSENGPLACVIDCDWRGRAFYFHSGEGANAIVDGFTITRGYVHGDSPGWSWGGGICCSDSEPTIRDCVFDGNSARNGGAVFNHCCSPSLTSCVFDSNDAMYGGAVFNEDSSPTFDSCSFEGNWASLFGGAMHNVGSSSPLVHNCDFCDNLALEVGGGMFNEDPESQPTIIGCTFQANIARGGGGMHNQDSLPGLIVRECAFVRNIADVGGGIDNSRCNLAFVDCTFRENWAETGGGVSGHDTSMTLTGCVFSGNTSTYGGGLSTGWGSETVLMNCMFTGNTAESGGGVHNNGASGDIVNCTFSGNRASMGGGIFGDWGSSLSIRNSIFAGNGTEERPWEIELGYGAALDIAWCNVQGGETSVNVGGGTLIWNDSNIDTDPAFVQDPDDGGDGWGDDPQTPGVDEGANDDYGNLRLAPGSPCIDSGDTTVVPADWGDADEDGDMSERFPYDLAGGPRFVDDLLTEDTGVADPPEYSDVVDMGAYEYQPLDADNDSDVDLGDFAAFQLRFTGPDQPVVQPERLDVDGDGDVDSDDYESFWEAFSCPRR